MGKMNTDLELLIQRNSLLKDESVERCLLGQFVQGYTEDLDEAISLLPEEAFDELFCQRVWRAIKSLRHDSLAIDVMSVYTRMVKQGAKDTAADVAALLNVQRSVAQRLALHLREAYDRRILVRGLTNAIDRCVTNEDLTAALAEARKTIEQIEELQTSTLVQIARPLDALVQAMCDRVDGREEPGIPTGFTIMDERGGLHLSDLTVIAGSTSMGKTSLGLCIIKNIAEQGVPCAVYSLEMSNEQLCGRLLAVESGKYSASDIMYKRLDPFVAIELTNHAMRLRELPIYIDERQVYDLADLTASIRSIVHAHGVKVVLLDYMQIMKVKGIHDDVKAMAEVARELKMLARNLNISVIALSQLSRVAKGDNPVPTMQRLRGSGGIEEAADNIYLIYRAEYYHRDYPGGWARYETHNTALLIRSKGRNIGTAERLLMFNPSTTSYSNWDAAVCDESAAAAAQSKSDAPWFAD
jgi:replicative DNA helicase